MPSNKFLVIACLVILAIIVDSAPNRDDNKNLKLSGLSCSPCWYPATINSTCSPILKSKCGLSRSNPHLRLKRRVSKKQIAKRIAKKAAKKIAKKLIKRFFGK